MTRILCQGFALNFGAPATLPLTLELHSYVQRTEAERYLNEETDIGPPLWDGLIPRQHRVRDELLKAPADVIPVELRHRQAERGEIDIRLAFSFEGQIPPHLIDALGATACSIMSLLNLQMGDKMIPGAPFQIIRELSDGKYQTESAFVIAVFDRHFLNKERIAAALSETAKVLMSSQYGDKLRVALELYAAHFTEQQVRVRFLLLVIALETLARPTSKHQAAVDLLTRWSTELEKEKSRFTSDSEEFLSLQAVSNELNFRTKDSLGTQVRKLFAGLPGINLERASELQRRASHIYNRRSRLVHNGSLPAEELSTLEGDARELLEILFTAANGAQSHSGVG